MDIKAFKELLLMATLVILPLSAEGATATALVTANIVPILSLAVSGSAVFTGSVEKYDSKGTFQVSTSGVDGSAKLRIFSSLGHDYGVSVSLPDDSDDEFNSALEIVDSRFTLDKGGVTKKGERELDFGGVLKIADVPKNESRSGYVYVTINFY